MAWTYRVVKRVLDGEVVYGIHEAYDDGDRAQPHSITAAPTAPVGDTVDALAETLTRMQLALTQPTLDDAAFTRMRWTK